MTNAKLAEYLAVALKQRQRARETVAKQFGAVAVEHADVELSELENIINRLKFNFKETVIVAGEAITQKVDNIPEHIEGTKSTK